MTDSLLRLLPWILPPVLGAIIGYITNAVAIRMLFRPYRRLKIFGIPLPLTPGIIPKQRAQLAENIGQMVSKELLTEDALTLQIQSDAFQKGIRQNVEKFTADVFHRPLKALVGGTISENSATAIFKDLIRGFVGSKTFENLVNIVVRAGLQYITSLTVDSLIGEEGKRERLISLLVEGVTSVPNQEKLLGKAESWIQKHTEENTKLDGMIPENAADWLCSVIEMVYEPVMGFLVSWLRRDAIRSQLEIRGRYLLRDVLEKLSSFQRLIVAAAQYDRTLDEKMPQIIDDVLAALDEMALDTETRKALFQAIRGWMGDLRNGGLADVQDKYDLELKPRAKELFRHFFSLLRDSRQSVHSALAKSLNSISHRTIESLLENVLNVEDAAEYLADLAIEHVSKSAGSIADSAIKFLSSLSAGRGDVSLAELIGLDGDTKAKIDRQLSQMAVEILAKRIPTIVGSFDIYHMVVDKINGLNVEEVEGLLMRVIHRHLKWINVFGALLGFLIGMTQVALRFIVP